MDKCRRAGVDTPSIYFVDLLSRRLFMEFIDGVTVKQLLFSGMSDLGTVRERFPLVSF
jgi:tRNA A-37 threonylcarbamoyl transferase component Bud32